MKKSIGILIHLGLWVGMYLLFIHFDNIVVGLIDYKKQSVIIPFFYGTLINAGIFYGSATKKVWGNKPSNSFVRRLIFSLGILIIFTSLETGIDKYFVVDERLQDLAKQGVTPFMVNSIFNTVFIFLAFTYRYIADWFNNERQKRALTEENLKHELAFLKSQINPHFLFNSLNNLFSLAQEEEAIETAQAISKLANLLRYMIYDSDKPAVELAKEIEYLDQYVELQKARLPVDRDIDISLKVEGNPEGKQVAPALFIPIVENAFKYGISYTHKTSINFLIEVKDGELLFSSYNNIVLKK